MLITKKELIQNIGALIAVLCFSPQTLQAQTTATSDDLTTTSYNSIDFDIQQVRLAQLKTQLLRALNLEDFPNATKPVQRVPTPILQRMSSWSERQAKPARQEDSIHPLEIGIHPDTVFDCHSVRPAACLQFNMSDLPSDLQVRRAHMLMHRSQSLNTSRRLLFTVTEWNPLPNATQRFFKKIAMTRRVSTSGWMTFNVGPWLTKWLKENPGKPLRLQLTCKTCRGRPLFTPIEAETDDTPYLVINGRMRIQERQKRSGPSYECSPGLSGCCRAGFTVNMPDIWNGIVKPTTLNIYYCRGECQGLDALHLHGRLFQKNRLSNRLSSQLCCGAKKLAAHSICYYPTAWSGNYICKTFKDIIIASCGCA